MRLLLLVASAVVLIDQLSKRIVLVCLAPHESISVIPHVFHITLIRNTGIAFGLFRNHTALATLAVAGGFILLAGMLLRLGEKSVYMRVACAFMLGGALGNVLDRIQFGAVIDFLDFIVWPVFNLADTFISIAAGLFIIALLRKGT